MRELTIPSNGSPAANSVARYVVDNAESFPTAPSLRIKSADGWADVSSQEFLDRVTALAAGLVAAGISAGDRVALMSRTRWEWTLIDFAVLMAGGIVVPVYETSSASQVEWILSDSGCVAAFCENDGHLARLDAVRGSLPDLRSVWQIDGDDLSALAAGGDESDVAEVGKRMEATTPADIASIIYTSGTTGRPKGCLITHSNILSEIQAVRTGLRNILNRDNSTLLFLPIAHIFGRVIQFGAVATGAVLGHTSDVADLVEDLGTFHPTFVLGVPRVFEKVYNTAAIRARAEHKAAIFGRAEKVAVHFSESLDRSGPSPLLRLEHAVFDRLVYSRLRAALGGRCTSAISGGAPLGVPLGHFFRGVGVTVYEGYGLTETTAGICVNTVDALRIGTVGRPVPGTSVRIADDGEIWFASPLIFDGYHNDPTATAEVLSTGDEQAWFATGDLGSLDDDGFLTITGRKKEIIVTANGKNVVPSVLEDGVRSNWLVGQCLVVGDQKPYVAALITIDPDSWPAWLAEHGKPTDLTVADAATDPALLADLQAAVDSANEAVSHAEAIKRFVVLPGEWTEAGGQLTPSLKIKRRVVLAEHATDIEQLYASGVRS